MYGMNIGGCCCCLARVDDVQYFARIGRIKATSNGSFCKWGLANGLLALAMFIRGSSTCKVEC